MKTYIYGLYDTQDQGRIRYVGTTKGSLKKRLGSHCYEAKHGSNDPVHAWIRSIGSDRVSYAELETCDAAERNARETHHILALGTLTDVGGFNLNLGSSLSKQQRTAISDRRRGRALSAEHRAAIGAGLRNSPRAAEAWSQLHKSLGGRAKSAEHRQAISAAKRGTTASFQAARVALHVRWHVNRGLISPNCPLCSK